jgi:hypothetical protein
MTVAIRNVAMPYFQEVTGALNFNCVVIRAVCIPPLGLERRFVAIQKTGEMDALFDWGIRVSIAPLRGAMWHTKYCHVAMSRV